MDWRQGRWASTPAPTRAVTFVDHDVWTLVKGERRAVLVVRQHPCGQELRCSVDGQFLWSEVFPPGDGVRLGAVAAEHKAAWEAKGWRAAG